MAREMYLVGVSEEELKPAPKAEPPRTPKGKLENFWYHYKWAFLGGLFGIVVLTVLIVQAATVNRPDYQVVLVTKSAYLDYQLEPLEKAMAAYGCDLDEDGEVEVQIINCYMGQKNSNEYLTNSQVLQAHIISGDVMMYVWEPKNYESFMDMVSQSSSGDYRFLTTLPFTEGTLEEATVWNWADSAYREGDEVLKTLPEDLYFGVRNASGTAEESRLMYEQALELLTGFATGEKPAAK